MEKLYICSWAHAVVILFFLSLSFQGQAQLLSTTVFAGGGVQSGGPAVKQQLVNPIGVAVTSSAIYIADSGGIIHKADFFGNMTTIAGGGFGGIVEGGQALDATLNAPCGIVADRAGNVYITESLGNRVRKITPAGIITTVAGTGVAGYNGDGIAGTSAQLNIPTGLTLDSAGNLFIADQGNNRIRKLNTSGIISTMAGTGTGGYDGDGISATTAQLSAPFSLAMDSSGNLFIGDIGNLRVRKVDGSGIISTYAGNGTTGAYDTGIAVHASVDDPRGLAVDSVGNLFISDGIENEIYEVDTTGRISYFASLHNGGLGTNSVDLRYPAGLSVDSLGNVYVSNEDLDIVQDMVPGRAITNTIAGSGIGSYDLGNGNPLNLVLSHPLSVYADKTGNVFFTDGNRLLTGGGSSPLLVAGTGTPGSSGDGGPADSAQLNQPYGICEDPMGNLYVGTRGDNKIRKITPAPASIISTFAGTGTAGYGGDNGPATQATLAGINGLWGDALGNIYVSDSIHAVVRKIDTNGVITTIAGTGVPGYSGDGGAAKSAQLGRPNGIGTDNLGNIYIGDDSVNSVRKIDTTGMITTIVGGSTTRGLSGDFFPATAALFGNITNILTDDIGDVYTVDPTTRTIRQYNVHNGLIFPFTGGLTSIESEPLTSISLSGSGNFYVSDTATNTIVQLNMFYFMPSTDDTVTEYVRKPYFSGPPTPYYNTAVIDNDSAVLAWRRILTLDPSYGATVFNLSPLPQGRYTFISHVDTAVQTYNGIPLDTRHYEIIPPTGGDSVQDVLQVWIALTDAAKYDNYVNAHNLSLPLLVDNIHQTLNGNNIRILAFHGAGNTPATPTGDVEEILPNQVGYEYSNVQFNLGVDYYIVTFESLHGFSNFYFTTGTITPLPLTLLSFTGSSQGDDALLKWTTTNEINTQSFIVQRSPDTSAFVPVGSVSARSVSGTNTYSYIDKGLAPGMYYYRLKMQDRDGNFTYSRIVSVSIGSAATGSLVLYPNPAKDIVYCQLQSGIPERCNIQLTDRQGNILQTRVVSLNAGTNLLSFNVASLPAGSYIIVADDGNRKQVGQFVK